MDQNNNKMRWPPSPAGSLCSFSCVDIRHVNPAYCPLRRRTDSQRSYAMLEIGSRVCIGLCDVCTRYILAHTYGMFIAVCIAPDLS